MTASDDPQTTAPRSLWLTNDFPPRSGGIEQLVANLVATLPPDSVRVLASPWEGDAEHDRSLAYSVERISRRPLLPTPAVLREVREHAADHRADVVVFGSAWPLAELGDSLRDDPGIATLGITHGREAGMVRFGFSTMIKRLGRACSAMTTLSDFTGERLEPVLTPLTDVHRLPGGVDTTLFTPEGPDLRDRLGIAEDRPVVACISRLVPRKGQDQLLRIWPRVLQQHRDALLLLVGTGPLEGGLRRAIASQGLGRSVIMTGEVAWDLLPDAYRTADVFAMPCRTRLGGMDVEGLGLVFLEAQACGIPVIAGDSGGAPETVVDGVTGLVVDGDDDASVLAAVTSLLADPVRRAEMGAAGRDETTARWDWSVIGTKLRTAMQAAIGQHAASQAS